MTDVFISYSRKDKDFVRRLDEALVKHNRDSWVDWKDIPPAADWLKEIYGAIEEANTFVFIVSPDSIVRSIHVYSRAPGNGRAKSIMTAFCCAAWICKMQCNGWRNPALIKNPNQRCSSNSMFRPANNGKRKKFNDSKIYTKKLSHVNWLHNPN